MHKSIATSTILEHELSELRLLVERQTGVVLDCPNSALAAHVAEFIEAQELDSSTALLERLRSAEQDPSTLPSLLDGLISGNTGFFRHPGALNALSAAGAAATLHSQVRGYSGANPHMERRLRHGRRNLLHRNGGL